MSPTEASSRCAAIAVLRSRRTDAVSAMAPAVIEPDRLPPVPPPNGVRAVSPWTVLTSAMSTPRASSASWTTVVSMLLPLDPPVTYTFTLPDGSIRIVAPSVAWTPTPLLVGSM
jgi:hypothetical protein